MLLSGGPSIRCLFKALVDWSIIESEADEVDADPDEVDGDPLDACDGDHSDTDELSEEQSSTLVYEHTHSIVLQNSV